MAAAGFELLDVGARYECQAPPTAFATYLADRRPEHREAIEAWESAPGALYAMTVTWTLRIAVG